jgi:O-antigen ligase
MSSRTQIYETTLKMINDYGLFGSGPGSFEAIYQFELGGILNSWQSWAHNDYLEFYLTFGQIGTNIMLLIVFCVTSMYILSICYESTIHLKWFELMALLGATIHATVDFPLQVYSILSLITIIASTGTALNVYYKVHS